MTVVKHRKAQKFFSSDNKRTLRKLIKMLMKLRNYALQNKI